MNNTESKVKKNIFLFSLDLEDIRFWMDDGLKYKERVPLMTEKYLDFLDTYNFKTTFFVVGEVAKMYPELIAKIAQQKSGEPMFTLAVCDSCGLETGSPDAWPSGSFDFCRLCLRENTRN